MSQSKKRLISRKWVLPTAAAVIGLVATPSAFAASGYDWGHHGHDGSGDNRTATPIKHVVVLFDENVSYDHYFGTYPKAANDGQGTPFTAKRNTPKANGLTPALLTANPNQYNPQRLSPSQALTCDQNHGYTAEQKAVGQRQERRLRPEHERVDLHRPAGPVRRARPGHGLLRRQHRHRSVELRAELRDERQRLQRRVRPVDPRRAEPDLRPDLRRHRGELHHAASRSPPRSSAPRTPPASAPCPPTRTRRTTTARTTATPRPRRWPRCPAPTSATC